MSGYYDHNGKFVVDTQRTKSTPTPTLHTIKPLEWETYDTGKEDRPNYPIASTSIGFCYEIHGNYWSIYKNGCLQEKFPCTSIEDGKAQAEAHYREQLGKCLEVYNG